MTPEQERQLMAYLELIMSGGQGSGQMGLDLYPTVDKKVGDTNYYQDRVQMLGDPLAGAMAGPGAFNFDAFTPTIERTPVDNIGWLKAQQWANAPVGSATRTIYDLVTLDGKDVGTAIQIVRDEVEADTEGVTDLTKSLPLDTANQYGEINVGSGLRKLEEQAYEMAGGLAGGPTNAIPDGMGGYYTETETPSALAEEFAAMGLPNPIDQYEEASPETAWKHLDREGVGYRGDSPADMGGLAAQSAALNSKLTNGSSADAYIREQMAEMALSGDNRNLTPDALAYMDSMAEPAGGNRPPITRRRQGTPIGPPAPDPLNPRRPDPLDQLERPNRPLPGMPQPTQEQILLQQIEREREANRYPGSSVQPTQEGMPQVTPRVVTSPASAQEESMSTGQYSGRTFDHVPDMKYYSASVLDGADLPSSQGSSDGAGMLMPWEVPEAAIGGVLGRVQGALKTPEGEGGGGGNPLDVVGRFFGGGGGSTPTSPRSTSRMAGGDDLHSILREKSLAEALQARTTQRRGAQQDIFQGVRDRRKARMASDPGSQDAINAYAVRGATEAGRTPFMDAMRERMLMQQISGF